MWCVGLFDQHWCFWPLPYLLVQAIPKPKPEDENLEDPSLAAGGSEGDAFVATLHTQLGWLKGLFWVAFNTP